MITASQWVYLTDYSQNNFIVASDGLGNEDFSASMANFTAPVGSPDAGTFVHATHRLEILSTTAMPLGAWKWWGWSMNTTAGTMTMFLDDVDISTAPIWGGNAFVCPLNGLSFSVGTDLNPGDNLVGKLADPWFAVGQNLDFTVTANRRKFISASGGPVNLGADGSAPTGTAPTCFYRRAPSAAATTFANDLSGNGNNLTITGTLTSQTGPS